MPRVLKPFEYLEPKAVEEAVKTLAKYGTQAKALAGGTDLITSMKQRKLNPQYIVFIKGIPGLAQIRYSSEGGLKIGALATHQSIASSPIIKDKFGLLATACNKIATPQIRNMATIGGNICMAGPSQDSIPPLLALEAKLKLVGPQGERIVPITEFYIAPFKTVRKEAELLTEIQIATPSPHSDSCYQWVTKMSSVDETLVGVAVLMTLDATGNRCQDIRIGLCSVAPTPMRARRAEELLRGKKIESKLIEQVAQMAAEETSPRSRADYRRRMSGILVKRAINEVWQKMRKAGG